MTLKLLQPGVLSTNTTPQLGASLSTRTTGFSSGLISAIILQYIEQLLSIDSIYLQAYDLAGALAGIKSD